MLQSEKINCSCNRAIYSATVAVDIRQPHFGIQECAFSVMLEWLEVETGISGKGAGLNSKGAAAIPNRGLARHDPVGSGN